jgi:hypothetical protein
MKFLNKLLIILLALSLTACSDILDLDLQDNPNAVTPENASLNDLYNNIQLNFVGTFLSAQFTAGASARMYHAGGGTYEDFAPPEQLDGLWTNAYTNLFPDIDALLAIAEPGGFDVHAGSAKIMKAYTMLTLVDLLGNVPNSQALQGTDQISPGADADSDVYSAALALLDEAIGQLSSTSASSPAYEGFFGGNTAQWIRAANTLKFKAALNTKDASTINSLVSSNAVIASSADDFAAQFGNQRANPNSRHWMYNNHYEANDGNYLSNYFMWLLNGDKVSATGAPIADPRSRYYFYRKVEDAGAQDQTTYSCHFSIFPDQSAKPAHWEATSPNVPYCIIPNTGYSGRDHLNPDGIPPDGPIRTSYGLYPGGGQFDDDSFGDTRQAGTSGGLGAGIVPLMLSSMTDLMRAEAALSLGTNDDARALLESGIRASMAKVVGFESLVSSTMSDQRTLRDGSSGTVRDLYGATDARIDNYVSSVLELYDAASADGKLDLVVKEQLIASWGNGVEAYNLYKRTGKPNNMQPALEPVYGEFPRTFLLPAIHVTRNANATQKTFTDRVFWDDGSIDLY